MRKKTFAIKHDEGSPLSRRDIQYDLLRNIFSNDQRVFTNPFSTSESDAKVTFRDLYVQALVQSPRCSRALRDKLQDMPEFGTDFAMISLLANVGRVNTTMTCTCKVLLLFVVYTDDGVACSPSGDEDVVEDVSSCPCTPDPRRESPGRASHQKPPEGLRPEDRDGQDAGYSI